MSGVVIDKAIHLECMPSSPLGEAEWVEEIIREKRSPVTGIVAACDLSADNASAELAQLRSRCPHLVGIRYILDYAGPWGEAPATHVSVSRHSPSGSLGSLFSAGADFLRDPVLASKFEKGFSRLAEHGLCFDLQCAPEQLSAAAALIRRHPGIPVVVDHFGKPRLGSGDDAADSAELISWRQGMMKLAKLDHVYVKLSMLGYSVPGWAADAAKEMLLASLVHEMIELFGPKRCMFSTNWWSDGAMANSDGRDQVPISMAEMWQRYFSWVEGRYSEDEIQWLFSGTAEKFYGI